jgi:hypothetical protein
MALNLYMTYVTLLDFDLEQRSSRSIAADQVVCSVLRQGTGGAPVQRVGVTQRGNSVEDMGHIDAITDVWIEAIVRGRQDPANSVVVFPNVGRKVSRISSGFQAPFQVRCVG